ncbi:MAG: spore coat associated protein CotJA [Clostridia bacterium]|nr:spore coat associated protein CotJA [Clostridia bacterium]
MDTGLCGPLSLAMAYVPKQYWRALYGEHEGMHAGTLFRELDKPFLGEKMGDQNAKR